MVAPIAPIFTWQDGKLRSPQEVSREREIAEALMFAKPQATGPFGALGQIGSALSGSLLDSRADAYTEQGREAASNLFAGIGSGSSADAISAALLNPAAEWATPAQSGIAEALFNNEIRQSDPAYQLDLAYKQAQIAAMEREAQMGPGGNESFFGNVVPMQDENGNIVLGQMSNQGRWQPLQGAEGYSPAPTTKQIDTGTEIITTDIYGNELYRTPKENRQAAFETGYGSVEGKTEAENVALAESVASKLPGLRVVIDNLTKLADTATYTQSGQIMDSVKRELGLPVGQGAIDRASYIAIVDNQVLPLLRDTFGAAFTQKEGESLRATLGDPNKSPEEKKAILEAFITQKERDIEGMRGNMPGSTPLESGGNVIDWTDL